MENRKTKIISVVAVVALALTVITATYAYFQAQVGDPASADIKVNANTVDTFTFSNGSAISFSINQDNFASGKGNQTGSTYASATLTANNKTNTATDHYYLYLNIESNTFTYSINESTPEIIMTVTDSSGNEVTDISTLNHVIVTGANGDQVSGYDITNKNGLITLFNNREITTTSSKEERWNIKVTFVNYDASQSANAGKSMSAKVMIQKNKLPEVVSDVCDNEENLATCITTLSSKSTSSLTNIYHHDASLANGAGDNSYRYAGASESVNNYVCFGSTQSPCPADNLYRIIGVFDNKVGENQTEQRVKLIKSTSVGKKAWDSNNKNTWSGSSLNTYLNNEFINTFDETIKGNIAETTWKVGGFSSVGQPAKTVYQNEVVKPEPGTTSNGETEHPAKIGLMYVSDYGFAAAQSAWTTNLWKYYDAAIKSTNWMFLGAPEWTISRHTGYSYTAFYVPTIGYLNYNNYHATNAYAVRPVFNLSSSVNYVSGSGEATDPITIN